MTADTPEPVPGAALRRVLADRRVITFRVEPQTHRWLRRQAYLQNRTIQSILDEALTRYAQTRLLREPASAETLDEIRTEAQAEPLIIDDLARSRAEQEQAGGPA